MGILRRKNNTHSNTQISSQSGGMCMCGVPASLGCPEKVLKSHLKEGMNSLSQNSNKKWLKEQSRNIDSLQVEDTSFLSIVLDAESWTCPY